MAQKHGETDLESAFEGASAPRPFPYLRVLAIVLSALLVLALLSVWLFRARLVEAAVLQWCQSKALACRIVVSRIGPGGAELDLDMGGIDQPPAIRAEGVVLDLVWANPLAPVLESVSAKRVDVRMGFDGEGVDLGGVEALALPSDPDAPQPPPQQFALNLPDIALQIATPVGSLSGQARATGRWPDAFSTEAAFAPATLSGPGGEIVLSRLTLAARLDTGRLIEADLSADIAHFTLAGRDGSSSAIGDEGGDPMSGDGARMTAKVSPFEDGYRLVASFFADRLARGDAEGEQIQAKLDLDYLQIDPSAPLGALIGLNMAVTGDAFALPGLQTGPAGIALGLKRAAGGALTGPMSVQAQAVAAQDVTVSEVELEGRLDLQMPFVEWPAPPTEEGMGQTPSRQTPSRLTLVPPQARLSGQLSARGVNARTWVEGMIGPLAASAPNPLNAAIEGVAAQIEEAASSFSLRAPVAMMLTPAGWRAELTDTARLSARSGLELTLTQDGDVPLLAAQGEGATLSGGLALEGGGPLGLTLGRLELGMVAGETVFATGPGQIDLGGPEFQTTLALAAAEGRIQPGLSKFGWVGRTAYSGRLLDLEIEGLTLDGAMGVEIDENGTRVKVAEACPVLRWSRLDQGPVKIGPAGGTLCAMGEAGVLWSSKPAEGGVWFRPGQLAFRQDEDLAYSVGIEGASVRVPSAGGGVISAAVSYSALSGRVIQQVGQIDLDLGAGRAAIRLPGGAIEARGVLTGKVSGTALPAVIVADAASFTARNDVAGLAVVLDTFDVRVTDGPDAQGKPQDRFAPLRVQGEGRLSGSRARLEGTIKLDASRVVLADFVAEDDRTDGEGWINLKGRRLVFQPGQLQLSDISPLLLGVASNAAGQAELDARADWTPDGPSASGQVGLFNLSFATFRLGPITGVSGTIMFDDLIAVHTPPAQRLAIGRINPGLALDNGLVVFQVLSPTEFILERAAWPFAGGLLSIEEARWRTGSEEERLVAIIEALDLGLLLKTFDVPGLEATGTASGRVPLVIRGPQLLIDKAILRADGGRIRYVNDMARAAGQASQATQIAFQALENFSYSVLELGLDGDIAGRMNVSAILEGANPDVIYGIPIRFEIAVDAPLMSLVHQGGSMLSGSQAVQTVKDAVREGRSERVGGNRVD